MENIEVGVLDSSSVEIWRGESLSVKGSGIFPIALAANTDKMSILVNTSVADVSSDLRLPFLVKEDNRVEMRLSTIILYLSLTRMVGVLKVASKWRGKANGLRGGGGSGNSRLVLSEVNGFVTIDAVIIHVQLSEVENMRDEE